VNQKNYDLVRIFIRSKCSAGSAKLTVDDDGVISDVTNSDKTADFTGTVDFGQGQIVTATLTGDAEAALSIISSN